MKAFFLAVASLTIALACVQETRAEDILDTTAKFDIGSGPLDAALVEFSEQARVPVSTDGEMARRYHTSGVRGEQPARAALTTLLAQSELTFRTVDGTVQITRRNDSTAPARELRSRADVPRSRKAEIEPGRTSTGLEEVIVTAQKREERLQDVPISISALSGDELDTLSVQGTTDALRRVPGVVTTEGVQGGGTQIAVRGVTAHSPLGGGSSPVAYYIDGAPFGLVRSAVAPDPGAYDLARVEVLRGPQGTLYGASAMNGVVRVLTQDADLEDLELKARGLLSSTKDGGENYRGDMAINVPIVPSKLAARAVVGYQDWSGWIDAPNKNDVNDAQLNNVRLKLNAQPTEALTIGISAWLARNDYGAPSLSDDDRKIGVLLDQPITTDYDTYGLTIGYDFPMFSVTSVTSYLDYRNRGFLDLNFVVPNFTLTTDISADVFTQEVYLASTSGESWRWTLGGMYRDGEDSWNQIFQAFRERSESFAIFGELTRRFLDGRLELTGGLRYFQDDVSLNETIPSNGDLTRPLIRAVETFDALTPRVILTWHAGDALTLYGSYSEGFRSGASQGPNILRLAPSLPPAEPDTLKNYEVGAKGSLLDSRLAVEAALFYIDWRDVQLVLNIPFMGVNANALVNGESASGIGFEAAVTAQPVDGFTLGTSLNWNDLTLDSDVISAGAVLFGKGDRPNLSSEYTVGAFADYTFPLGTRGFEGRFSASADYHSPLETRQLQGAAVRIVRGDHILVARTSFSIEAPKHWSATLFVDNLADEKGKVTGVPNRAFWDQHPRPRTIGVQLECAFGR